MKETIKWKLLQLSDFFYDSSYKGNAIKKEFFYQLAQSIDAFVLRFLCNK
jgi:hypothetical protein